MVSLTKRVFLQVNLNVKEPKGNSRSVLLVCFLKVTIEKLNQYLRQQKTTVS